MCGIVGYAGHREAAEVLFDALKRLEYRGYDSAGVALLGDGIQVIKDKGRIGEVERSAAPEHSNTGIGHTRWATHGRPSKQNAHPHLDCKGNLAVVHNGIIENFIALREELSGRGHTLSSDTDSEVIAHLLEENYGGDLKEAMLRTVKRLEGSYAIVAIHRDRKEEFVVARNNSPLVMGIGEGENLVASDVPAILGYTDRVVFMKNGQCALVRKNEVKMFDDNGMDVEPEITRITWTAEDAEKGGYPHFMLKEIYEQPRAIREAMLGKRGADGDVFVSPLLEENFDSIKIIACGTSYHAGLVGKYAIGHLAGIPVSVEIASEYRYAPPGRESPLTIFITQSGETADTLAAAKESVHRGLSAMAITNVVGSSITREVDDVIFTNAGPEIGVAATKSYITQLVVFYLMAIQLGRARKTITPERARTLAGALRKLPRIVENILRDTTDVERAAARISKAGSAFFIGRNINYPTALEGAIKLKEISYIHAEGFPAGELKHGPIALLDDRTPVIALAPHDFLYEKMCSNIGEVLARDAPVICVVTRGDRDMEKYVDEVLSIPRVDPLLSPIPITVVLQLLAYHCAELRKCSIDKPRNLAKSVTVE